MAGTHEKALTGKLGKVRAASVINPLLWLDGLLVVALIPIACIPGAAEAALNVLCWLLGLCVVATIAAFAYFSKSDPDRLQTENHRYAMYSLQQQQGRTFESKVTVIQAAPMMNPALGEDKK